MHDGVISVLTQAFVELPDEVPPEGEMCSKVNLDWTQTCLTLLSRMIKDFPD